MHKLRELFELHFTSEEEYRKTALIAKHDKSRKKEATKLNEAFNQTALQVLGVKVGTFGQMKSLFR